VSKVAVVTGAGSGIGRASGLALAGAGFDVVFAGRRSQPIDQAAREAGEGSAAVVCDVRDPAAVAALFAQVERLFGRLDLLFNNAGISAPAVPLDELDVADWQAVVDTNLTGMFLCTRQAVGLMKRQEPRGGRIINNGSISAHVPRPGSVAYTSTKHAVTGLTKSIALDGRQYDICSCQIDIGNAATPMTARSTNGQLQPYGQMAVEPRMDVNHVGQQILFMSNLPLESNVQFVTIMATKMPFIGRG
jgi:NAD(P)-dependent dehydrogenase (short-subunit alcohol dehydrogenase family)